MFEPKFDVKLHGHATARYLGPTDDESLAQLIAFFRREKWKGQLVINWPGNGGINDVTFTEVRRASEVGA